MDTAYIRAIGVVAAFAVSACGDVHRPLVCTQIGCESGLTVHLSAQPVGAFRVEVFALSPNEQPAYVFDCPADSSCPQDLFFPGLIVRHPFIRITTSVGTRTIEVLSVTYISLRPNGVDCPGCEQATVAIDLPLPLAPRAKS